MFESGLLEEVRRILDMGYPPSIKPFESLGYRQALQLIRGELNLREAIFYAQRTTRQYAKRQITWFRREPGLEWLQGFGDSPRIRDAAIARVDAFLSGDWPVEAGFRAGPSGRPARILAGIPSAAAIA